MWPTIDQTADVCANALRAANHFDGSFQVSRNHLWKMGGNFCNTSFPYPSGDR